MNLKTNYGKLLTKKTEFDCGTGKKNNNCKEKNLHV